jgi:hypothetical protein
MEANVEWQEEMRFSVSNLVVTGTWLGSLPNSWHGFSHVRWGKNALFFRKSSTDVLFSNWAFDKQQIFSGQVLMSCVKPDGLSIQLSWCRTEALLRGVWSLTNLTVRYSMASSVKGNCGRSLLGLQEGTGRASESMPSGHYCLDFISFPNEQFN